MKKVLLVAGIVFLCQSLYAGTFDNGNEKAKIWAQGFEACLLSLGREYKIQGVKPKSIFFKKHMIYVDASAMSSQHKLLLQQFGFDGVLEPVRLDGGWIVFGSYDYLPDAESLKERLSTRFFDDGGIQVKIYDNSQNKMFLTEKSFYESIAMEIEKEIKQNVPVMVIERPMTQAPSPIETRPVVVPPPAVTTPIKEQKSAKEQPEAQKKAFFDKEKEEALKNKNSKNSKNTIETQEQEKIREFVLIGEKVKKFQSLTGFQEDPVSKKLVNKGVVVNEGQVLQTGYSVALKDTGFVMVKLYKQNVYIPMEFVSFVD